MITWFGFAQVSIALVAMIVCIGEYSRKRPPNDYTLGATLLVGLLLIAQVVISFVQPIAGNPAKGDPLEFWMYLVVALLIPFGAALWALIDRKRSANLVLVVVNLTIAVMLLRMMAIWE